MFWSCLSWWVTIWVVQPITIVSLCLQDCLHQCQLDRERRFLELSSHGFMLKYRPKMVRLSCLGYLGEIESNSGDVWTCMYTMVSSQRLFRFSSPKVAVVYEIRLLLVRTSIRFLAGPARMGPEPCCAASRGCIKIVPNTF